MVLFMIIINDKPFYGYVSISSDPYKLILKRVIDASKWGRIACQKWQLLTTPAINRIVAGDY